MKTAGAHTPFIGQSRVVKLTGSVVDGALDHGRLRRPSPCSGTLKGLASAWFAAAISKKAGEKAHRSRSWRPPARDARHGDAGLLEDGRVGNNGVGRQAGGYADLFGIEPGVARLEAVMSRTIF